MGKIYIDKKEFEANPQKNLLESCLSLGFDLPYFCWHPAMGSVGACRQCAVKKYKDENDTQGKIVMACMEPSSDGSRISVEDPEAVEFRESVIEWLMTNHPHDCPTCDEGGECHLQDMTVMSGHNYRRHRFNKRTYRNQDLGPFLNHEMNRCIQCYRCVRFYNDYAGGKDFGAFASRNRVYFGRHEPGTLENEFSGNLAEVCPTGVFTDKTLKKHYTRKWDFTYAPSICHNCGLGCNIIPGERYGELRRIQSRYNGKVNGYFICDRGRFGYEYVNRDDRIRKTMKKKNGSLQETSKDDLLKILGNELSQDKKVIGIGSPRASLESNYALWKLVGKDQFYHGVSGKDHRMITKIRDILQKGPARTPSLKETEDADAILILGEDLTNTAPMMALSLRQAARKKQIDIAENIQIPAWHDLAVREAGQQDMNPLYIVSLKETRLDDVARDTKQKAPADIARLGFAIAANLQSGAPEVKDLNKEEREWADEVAKVLKEAKNPLVVSGTGCGEETIIDAAANIAWALSAGERTANLSYTVPGPNSLGLNMMGGESLEDAFSKVEKGEADTAVILENDLYRTAPKEQVDRFIEQCQNVIVLDYLKTGTVDKANIVVPVGPFAETDGTMVNNEGRAQRYYQVYMPGDDIQESWRWLAEITRSRGNGKASDLKILDDFVQATEKDFPVFKGISELAPPAGFRIAGQKIPRESHRYSGRTAMKAHINVSEPKPPEDPDSPFSYTMEGFHGQPPSSNIPYFWSPGWNSQQSINKFQVEVGGPLHGGDPGKRLIEPGASKEIQYFTDIPGPFKAKKDETLVVPVHHIFGSEELSSKSQAVQERNPGTYLAVNSEEADKLNVNDGGQAVLHIDGNPYKLPVRILNNLPGGIAGVPAGFPGLEAIPFPKWGKISKQES